MRLQASDCQGPLATPEAEREAQDRLSPRVSEGVLNTLLWGSGLQNCEDRFLQF